MRPASSLSPRRENRMNGTESRQSSQPSQLFRMVFPSAGSSSENANWQSANGASSTPGHCSQQLPQEPLDHRSTTVGSIRMLTPPPPFAFLPLSWNLALTAFASYPRFAHPTTEASRFVHGKQRSMSSFRSVRADAKSHERLGIEPARRTTSHPKPYPVHVLRLWVSVVFASRVAVG